MLTPGMLVRPTLNLFYFYPDPSLTALNVMRYCDDEIKTIMVVSDKFVKDVINNVYYIKMLIMLYNGKFLVGWTDRAHLKEIES
jgi:hypothetical protein